MSINLNVNGNTAPLEAAVQAAVNRIRKTPIKVTVDDKGATQPLGNMKRGADEFSKSMEAANARIIAFGASMAIINGISDAFKAMVTNVVQVEKALADINVVMGLSLANLDKFSDSLFKVAKETAASFDVAAAAATEYARQGLAVEETLKRTKDALILTRLTGMDSANAVKALTAAMNTYGDEIKDTTQLVSKFAAVDVKFAVSAEDFADAISRTGQAAKSAGVDIDELVGLVTAAQQKTARGGKVIGNSFKTIFTRIGRTDTLNQLENLGIAVRDVEGNTIGAKRILTDLANTFDSLTESQKAQIAQTVGGVFQINVLKAVLSDAAKQNGILANATQISAGATDEAIQKNEQLRSTMSAMASETGLALKEVSAKIGELAIAPGMEKILNIVKGFAEGASDMLGDGESSGNKFATGFLKGLGNIITGPGLVVIVAVFGKLFLKAAQYARESLSSLIGVTSEAQKQKAIQTSLVTLFGQNAALSKEMLRTDISRTEKERIILGLLKAQVVEANALNTIARSSAANLYQKGYGSNLAPRGKPRRTSAQGYIPNYVDAERQQAAQGGYAAGSIRSMNMPGEGSVIYNSAEKVKNFKGMSQPAIMPPKSSKAGENYQQAFDSIHGFDPYAAGGYIPNYAKLSALSSTGSKMGDYRLLLTEGSERKGQFQKGFGSLTKGEANLALRRSRNKKTTASTTSQLKDAGQIYNKSGKMVLFAASAQGAGSYAGDRKKNIIYLNPNATKGDSKFSKTNKKNMVPVNVPYFTIGKNDEERAKNDPKIKNKIEGDLIRQSQKTTSQLVSEIFKQDSIPNVIKSGDVAATVGNVFEKILMSVQKGVSKEAYDADPPGNALLDIPRGGRDALWDLFGATPLGSLGAEAKIALGSGSDAAHLKSAAEKFYKIDGYKGPGGKKAKAFAPAGKVQGKGGGTKASGHIPNFAAARLALTGGLVGKNKFGNIDRRQMTRLVRSNPYFNGLMNEHLTWDSFPKKDKRKLSRWLLKQGVSNRALQAYGLASMHSKSIGEGISNLAMAKGYIPNFADPLSDAIGREKEAGVPVSKIRIGSHPALMGKSNPVGLGVTNTDDEPNGLRDVFGAANGYVPNYAPEITSSDVVGYRGSGAQSQTESNAKKYNKAIAGVIKRFETGRVPHKKMQEMMQKLGNKYNVSSSAQDRVAKKTNQLIGTTEKLKAATQRAARSVGLQNASSRFAKTGPGKMFGSTAGQMGLMMGLPMAADFAKDAIGGKAGAATGGFLQGAGSGAAMGMMFGPLGTALGAAAGGLYGLYDASKKLEEAQDEAARAAKNRQISEGTQLGASLAKGMSGLELTGDEKGLIPTKHGFGFRNKSDKSGASSRMYNKLKGQVLEEDEGAIERAIFLHTESKTNLDKALIGSSLEGQGSSIMKMARSNQGLQPGQSGKQISKESFRKAMYDQAVAAKGTEARRAMLSKSIDQLELADPKQRITFGEQELTPSQLRDEIAGAGPEKIKAAYKSMLVHADQINDNLEKEADAIIIRLDFQKAQMVAQQAAAVKQLEIKDRYSEISENLKFEVMLMGSLMTDKQKAENKYLQAINKSAEAYEKSAASADAQLRTGLLNQIKGDKGVQGLVKTSLGLKEGSSFQDISEQVGSLSGKGLENKLREIADEETTEQPMRQAILELLSFEADKRQDLIDLAEEEQLISENKIKRERRLNLLLADRSQALKNLQRENRMESEGIRSSQKIRGFTEQVAAARRLNAVGPGYQTGRERESFAMSEKGFKLQSKIKTIEENRNINLKKLEEDKLKISDLTEGDKKKITRIASKPESERSKKEIKFLKKISEINGERQIQLDEIEQKIKNINTETDEEVESAKTLLDLEKQRLENKRKHETGSGAFGRGLAGGMKSMAEQVETMDYELGQRIPQAFADGLSNAMVDAINGTKSIKEGLMDAAIGFLGMIQKAMMQKMVMQAMGSMGFSQGGNVRNYSKGGNVPARVSDGEYLMSREAVNKYGGSFMHGLNAGGRAPEFASGGEVFSAGLIGGGISSKILEGKKKRQDSLRTAVENNLLSKGKIKREEGSMGAPVEQGSALAQNFGGGRGFDSGRLYQKRAMSSAFYAQSDNVGLTEDTGAMQSILSEEDHIRQMEKARREAKKAKRKQLMNMAIGVAAQFALGKIFSGSSGPKMGLGRDTISRMPESSFDFSGVKSSPVGDFSQFGDYNYSSQLGRLYNGGPIRKYASGGHIAGKSGIDQIPAMLSEGEYVIKASSARQLGKPMLDQINAGKFQFGGEVSPINSVAESTSSGGNTNNISISVNIKKGTGEDATQVEDAKPNSEDGGPDGAQEFADKIKTQVVAVIVQEQRPGGLLFD